MEYVVRDIQYALRGLRATPAFTFVAVATLALGIGVNSTMFSIVNAVLLRPLPVESPNELVDIYGRASNTTSHATSSWLDYLDLREQSQSLSGVIAYSSFFANVALEGRSELVVGEIVSDNYFEVLGVFPQIGRAFVDEEFGAELSSPVAILSHDFWSTRFGRRDEVVGESIRLNGTSYQVVGIMPRTFPGMFPAVTAQMWIPATMVEEVEPLGNQRSRPSPTGDTRLTQRGRRWLWMRGRMAPGIEVPQVQAELAGIMARLEAEHPDSNELETVTVLSTNSVHFNPDFDTTLVPAGMLMLGVVGLVLLVACANLANMLLARAAVRRREIAIRLAIGAARGRLVRQLLTESLTLALLGGAAGLMVASWANGLIARYQPPLPIDLSTDFSLDWRVVAFTLAVSTLTGVIFGLVPALRASRPDLVPALKAADAPEQPGRSRFHLRDVLVVVQVAVSIVLLVAGALMVRSLAAAQRVDLGYDPDHVAYLALAMEMNDYDAEQSAAFFDTAQLRLEALPGVDRVSLVSRVPLSINDNNFGVFIEGHQTASTDRAYVTGGAYVDEGYFGTLGLVIVQGRGLEQGDVTEQRRVVVVNETMAQRYWPNESAVGKQLRTSWEGEPREIVGVVRDYRVNTPGEAPTPYLHLPIPRQTTFGNFLVSTFQEAAAEVNGLEQELRTLDADLVFLDAGSMRRLADVRLLPVTVGAFLIGVFGLLALVLAAVGLYGVIGYSVSRRTREIGIRIALGAETGRLLVMVLRQGMVLVAVGGLVGAALAAVAGRLLASVLYVDAVDPVSFVAAFTVLAAVAALANWVPARRATRIDPMLALRSE